MTLQPHPGIGPAEIAALATGLDKEQLNEAVQAVPAELIPLWRSRPRRHFNTIDERINKATPDGCWNWIGYFTSEGYGAVMVNGVRWLAHRLIYTLANGAIPHGLTLDHLCRDRACVNPHHLEAVPIRENLLRGLGPGAMNSRKTHCKYGHPLRGDNLLLYDVRIRKLIRQRRECRKCNRDKMRRLRAARGKLT